VCVVDDDPTNLRLIAHFCSARSDLEVSTLDDGQSALDQIQAGGVDLLITDLRMPGLAGAELLDRAKDAAPHLPVLVMTGFGSVEGAVEMLHRGADDYLTKPIRKETFLHRLDAIVQRVQLAREVDRLRERPQTPLAPLIGQSPEIRSLKHQLPTIARTEVSVLVTGESGTGKELVARAIHELSRRATGPFVTINCAAIPENLLESELFGHRRGAFTDAHADTPGLVESASGGTLFLDEVGDLARSVQVKLLRFLELKEFKPVGAPDVRVADVRIVAATNQDLGQAIHSGRFREDLYYRLAVMPVRLPALRQRASDVPLLATHFVERLNRRFEKSLYLTAGALRWLEDQPWPGNVRELEHVLEQTAVMRDGAIRAQDLSPSADHRVRPTPPPETGLPEPLPRFRDAKAQVLAAFERAYVTRLLQAEKGHLSKAADRAGLDRKNLWQLMKRHDIRAEDFKPARLSESGRATDTRGPPTSARG
jgi:DNA-binding NtrC family response regulator